MLAKALQGAALATIPAYIEDVFSAYLWTGTDATQAINNAIDLSTYGGLVWMKRRDAAGDHGLFDTVRGANRLISNSTAAQVANTQISSFNTNGFTLAGGGDYNSLFGGVGEKVVGLTFRKQAKFFDVVTYTGNGANRTIAHNLGSVPGCMIIKAYSGTNADQYSWAVYHRSLNASAGGSKNSRLFLNDTSAQGYATDYWNSTDPTSTVFSLGANGSVNASGVSYVAYLFAHDAGGFGAAGTDNVISCGSFTTDGSGNSPVVNLGYEPQWLLVKQSGASGSWYIIDIMRAWNNAPSGSSSALTLYPNLSNAEAGAAYWNPTSTGFYLGSAGSANTAFIYIAIRRGPMKTPTSGTSVYAPTTWSGNTTTLSTDRSITGQGFPADLVIVEDRSGNNGSGIFLDRLRGASQRLFSYNTSAETATQEAYSLAQQEGILLGDYDYNYTGRTYVGQFLRRAPGFFDVVCFTTTSSANRRINHNLGVAPELIFLKGRSTVAGWLTYSAALGRSKYLTLQTINAEASFTDAWGTSNPTATDFGLNEPSMTGSGITEVAYLFATVAGVSKVGSYTGTGTTKQIDCGFAAGARFVLIKRTDSTGDWYVWDTARGIVSGNDPHLSLNTTAAEVTTDDTIDPDNSGFIVNQVAATNVNVNNASYIFLAVS